MSKRGYVKGSSPHKSCNFRANQVSNLRETRKCWELLKWYTSPFKKSKPSLLDSSEVLMFLFLSATVNARLHQPSNCQHVTRTRLKGQTTQSSIRSTRQHQITNNGSNDEPQKRPSRLGMARCPTQDIHEMVTPIGLVWRRINTQLDKGEKPIIQDLKTDLCDGVRLLYLLVPSCGD
jgi:hypothetical protein